MSGSATFVTSPFVHGSRPLSLSVPTPSASRSTFRPVTIEAMKKLQGRVVCSTNDKTVSVEVVRLAPHPKYKRRVRIKKKYQVHDPENKFAVGDFVQLEKSRPISKTKTFVAVAVPPRNRGGVETAKSSGEIGIPLQSEQTP